MTKLVSIIIPVYNVAKYVHDTIASVARQTYKNIEIIIIDDCGTDNSMEVVYESLSLYNLCSKIIKHPYNKGLSAARNSGLELSNGDYVYFLDSDDTIAPDCIKKHVQAITEKEADFTIAPLKMEGYKQSYFNNRVEESYPYVSYLKGNFSPSACNRLYSSSFLKNNKLSFVEGIIYEDVLWMYYLCLNSNKVAFVYGETYIYRVRENSLTTSSITEKNIRSMNFIIMTLWNEYLEGRVPQSQKRIFCNYFDRKRFIYALSLLKCNVSDSQKKVMYKKLQELNPKYPNIYGVVLCLHWSFFKVLLLTPYYVFKKYKNK